MNQNKNYTSIRVYWSSKEILENFKIPDYKEKQTFDDKIKYLVKFHNKNFETITNIDLETINNLLGMNLNIQWINLNKKEDINKIINHLIWNYESK